MSALLSRGYILTRIVVMTTPSMGTVHTMRELPDTKSQGSGTMLAVGAYTVHIESFRHL